MYWWRVYLYVYRYDSVSVTVLPSLVVNLSYSQLSYKENNEPKNNIFQIFWSPWAQHSHSNTQHVYNMHGALHGGSDISTKNQVKFVWCKLEYLQKVRITSRYKSVSAQDKTKNILFWGCSTHKWLAEQNNTNLLLWQSAARFIKAAITTHLQKSGV